MRLEAASPDPLLNPSITDTAKAPAAALVEGDRAIDAGADLDDALPRQSVHYHWGGLIVGPRVQVSGGKMRKNRVTEL